MTKKLTISIISQPSETPPVDISVEGLDDFFTGDEGDIGEELGMLTIKFIETYIQELTTQLEAYDQKNTSNNS